MELIERDGFLALLQMQLKNIEEGEGHCVFVSGEAGIGKTALVKAFCKQQQDDCILYQGACDALFTPRPLAPLYDIIWQVNKDLWPANYTIEGRSELFLKFFHELSHQKEKILIVFEDIHWADEATLDFIKFFSRRITQLRCLFILTFRDDEINPRHPIRNVFSDLSPDTFTRMQLTPLSKEAVYKLADEKGYDAENVYSISGGNPFYVNEILASYSPGIPDNIKDAILSVYDRQEEGTKHAWEICSVIPEGLEISRFTKIKSSWDEILDHCFALKIIVVKNGRVIFKHELYRRTIEASLSPSKRIALNKKILELFLASFEEEGEIERIVQYAKNANENKLLVKYAPLAARRAASVGAHIEASKLFLTAIEYAEGNDELMQFYEAYAYECYLTNQVKEAIIYTVKSLHFWKEKNDKEKISNSLRFLSRLWWFAGNRKNAESFAEQAIEVLDSQPPSGAKAMAYSNMSQLKMLSDQTAECIFWGEKAIAIARALNDKEALCHALNNVGCVQMKIRSSNQHGVELLQQSLEIALKNSYHEHAARAYTNMGSNALKMKEYAFAKKILDEGIKYCGERDLDSWASYMLSRKARLNVETGNWKEAYSIADNILKNESQRSIIKTGALILVAIIKMRRGTQDVLPLLLESKTKVFEIMGLQKIIPVLSALLEYEWITGKTVIETEALNSTISMIRQSDNVFDNNEFAFWLFKARKQSLPLREFYEGYQVYNKATSLKAAALWERLGCPYEYALCLFEGSEDDKRKAITIVHELGANAVYEKMKLEMRTSGIKSIPLGMRKTTRCNPAFLTGRELDILPLLKEGLQNKEIASQLFISPKTVDHHISSILFKLDVNSRTKAVKEAARMEII